MTQPRIITGRTVTWWFIAFFGVVFAVNFTMARFAISSFGGTVVDNSYVASQRYNGWLADARAQAALGWQVSLRRADDGYVRLSVLGADGQAVGGLRVTAVARQPLGQSQDRPLHFVAAGDAPGRWISDAPLPAGRWQIQLGLRTATSVVRTRGDIG